MNVLNELILSLWNKCIFSNKNSIFFTEKQLGALFNLSTFSCECKTPNNHNFSIPVALPESFDTLTAQLKTLFLRGFPLSAHYRHSWLSIYDHQKAETNFGSHLLQK